MKKMLIGLGIVASLYAASVTISTPITTKGFSKTISGSKSSSTDEEKALNTLNCYNAFSTDSNTGNNYIPSIITQIQKKDFFLYITNSNTGNNYIPSIITQIQKKDFFLYITNKCKNTGNLKITLIDKNTGKDVQDYTIQSISNFPVIKVNVTGIHKDLLVHFDYDKIVGSATSGCSITNGTITCSGTANTTLVHHEENSTDDFAVRPDSFYVHVDNNNTFVGKPLKIDISAIDPDGYPSQNYNTTDLQLNTNITDPNTYLSYCYNIINGEIAGYRFFFKKPSNNVKIQISEKLGQEWAITDADDTTDSRRLISEGESNSIKVNETSKSWAGTGTGKKANDPKTQTITSNIRDNTNRNIKYNRMCW